MKFHLLFLSFVFFSCSQTPPKSEKVVNPVKKESRNIFSNDFSAPEKDDFALIVDTNPKESTLKKIREFYGDRIVSLGNGPHLFNNQLAGKTLAINFNLHAWKDYQRQNRFKSFESFAQYRRPPILHANLVELADLGVRTRWRSKARILKVAGKKLGLVGISLPLECRSSVGKLLLDDPVKVALRETSRLRSFQVARKIFLINTNPNCTTVDQRNLARLKDHLTRLNGLGVAREAALLVNVGDSIKKLNPKAYPNLLLYSSSDSFEKVVHLVKKGKQSKSFFLQTQPIALDGQIQK